MIVKNNLKEIRMKGFAKNSNEFAEYLNVGIKTYSAWENGRSRPTLEVALKVAQKLNKTVEEIWYLD